MADNGVNDLVKKNRRTVIVLGAVLALIIVFWVALILFCNIKSTSEYVYKYTTENMDVAQDGLTITMDMPKNWEDKTLHTQSPYGAQYDFVIGNTSPYLFKDFSVTIEMSEKMVIDSGWNGEYEVSDNIINYVSTEPLNVLPGGEENTFGAVLYSEEKPELLGYEITGHWDASIKDSGWFWTLIELTSLYLLFLIFRLYSLYKQQIYDKKLKKDEEIIEQSMKTLTGFIDAKDAYTKDHSARVAAYAQEIGRRLNLDIDDISHLYYITLMHDCGKISIPDEILKKNGALTTEEFSIIKTHTTRGSELLKKFSALPGIGDGAHYHHERYDGYGYPSGLEGEDIPFYARIICVADAYDAMSSNRCYRQALSKEKILSELTSNSGKQFDPKFVPIMIEMIEDGFVDMVKQKYPVE